MQSGRNSPTPSQYDTSADNSREVSMSISRSTLAIDADAHEYEESHSYRERSMTDERKKFQEETSMKEIKSLLAWSNTYLSKRDFHATDLGADFADGVLLINLLEISTSGSVGKYCMRPIKPAQKLDNVSMAMVYMMQKGIKILSIDAHDIVAKKEKQILIVLWSILRFLTLAGLGIDQASGSARDIRSNLLNWCKESFGTVHGLQVNDFWSSFRDGVAFCAIVDKMAPGHIDMGKIRPENGIENLRLAFSVAEKHLGIPSVLSPEDFAAIKGDEKAVMNYVCMLVSAAAAARNTSSQKEVEAARLRDALLEAEQKSQQAHNEAEQKLMQQQKDLEELASKLASAQDQSSQSAENERKWRDTTNKWRESAKKWRESAEKWRASDEAKSQIIKKMQQQHELEIQKLNAEIYKMHREHEEVLERIREEKIREHTERKNDQPAVPDRYRHIRSRSQLKEQHIKDTKSDMDLLMGMPDRAGFLLRRRPNATFHKNRFKKLHFVLHGDSMEYWTEDQQKKKGAFNLVDYRFASEIPADKRYKEDGKDYIVRLNTTIGDKSNLTFEFKAPTEDAQKLKTTPDELTRDWMSAINTRIALLMYMKKKEARKGMGWGSNELVQFVTDPDATELVISHRLGIHEPLLSLRGALIGRTNLTHIHLEAVELNDEAVEVISDIVKSSTSIVSLALPNNKIGPSGAGFLCEALKVNQSLTSLSVQNNQLKDEGVMRIASSLPQHITLTELNLSGNAVADNGAIALSHALEVSSNKSNKKHVFPILQLAYNLIGDQGCIAIAQLITKNASITEIDLENNIIGDAGIQAISKAIEVTDSQIRALYLATNQISSKGIIALSHAFKATAGELTVDVSNNQLVSRSGIAALVDINVKIDYLSLKLLKPAFKTTDNNPIRSSMSNALSNHTSPNQDLRRVSFNQELKVVVGPGKPVLPGEDIDEDLPGDDDDDINTHFPSQTPKSKDIEQNNRQIAASVNGKNKENIINHAGEDPEEAEINAQLEQNSLLKKVIGKDHDDGLMHPHTHQQPRISTPKPE